MRCDQPDHAYIHTQKYRYGSVRAIPIWAFNSGVSWVPLRPFAHWGYGGGRSRPARAAGGTRRVAGGMILGGYVHFPWQRLKSADLTSGGVLWLELQRGTVSLGCYALISAGRSRRGFAACASTDRDERGTPFYKRLMPPFRGELHGCRGQHCCQLKPRQLTPHHHLPLPCAPPLPLPVRTQCMTDAYDQGKEEHAKCKKGIEIGNGLPDVRTCKQVAAALKAAGFEVRQRAAQPPHLNPPPHPPLDGRMQLQCDTSVRQAALLAPKGAALVNVRPLLG